MSEVKPVFVVMVDDHAYRIWADGRTEGFPSDKRVLVINGIPAYVGRIIEDIKEANG